MGRMVTGCVSVCVCVCWLCVLVVCVQVVCSLLAHRRFGELLVQHGGVQLLLALPR